DGDMTDVFRIQSELATKIASALQAKLSPSEKENMARKPTQVGEAYLAYQRAHELQSSAMEDYSQLKIGEEMYARAIELDPKFALAHARARTSDRARSRARTSLRLFLAANNLPSRCFVIRARVDMRDTLRRPASACAPCFPFRSAKVLPATRTRSSSLIHFGFGKRQSCRRRNPPPRCAGRSSRRSIAHSHAPCFRNGARCLRECLKRRASCRSRGSSTFSRDNP